MKKIYIYMSVCILIGVFMAFRQSVRYVFMEDLKAPSAVDLAWTPPAMHAFYEQKTLLELHRVTPPSAEEFITEKIAELKANNTGIHTVVLTGSLKVDTNAYIRALATVDLGIEEIRVHNTAAINIYAFVNLIKSSPSIKRILIRQNKWDEGALSKMRAELKNNTKLIVIKN
jgi:hypothetical protein